MRMREQQEEGNSLVYRETSRVRAGYERRAAHAHSRTG